MMDTTETSATIENDEDAPEEVKGRVEPDNSPNVYTDKEKTEKVKSPKKITQNAKQKNVNDKKSP